MDEISLRKKEHLDICINEDVGFKIKTNGFEQYDFIHHAITEVEIEKIDFSTRFLRKNISFPFLISCMTGGTKQAQNINAQLALAAEEINVPVGVGSQRQALENKKHLESFKIVRKNAPSAPVLANIGASEVVKFRSTGKFELLVDMIQADAFVIHVNPLQELIQSEGNTVFKGLLKKIQGLVRVLNVPVFVKEVGAGISSEAAKKLLDSGVKGIDVAGAGGTSWAGVEMLRKKRIQNYHLWDWGLPTSFCIREVSKLKKKYKFTLVGSGGIDCSVDAAKALALGADLIASARTILKELNVNGLEGVKKLIENWFEDIKHIMFLTGSATVNQFKKKKIIRKELIY